MLCRALVRRHYAKYGTFRAAANQPGVEFHLRLRESCALGDKGRWYGWQCRWYQIASGTPIGSARKKKIVDAIKLTERLLPEMTDWVLWTRHPLTKGDQGWFDKIQSPMRLHQWTAIEAEDYLSGDAEILRSTYFDELVLAPGSLADLHKISVASIRERWMPEVHQTVDAERDLRRMLGEADTWGKVAEFAATLRQTADAGENDSTLLTGTTQDRAHGLVQTARMASDVLLQAYRAMAAGDLDALREQSFEEITVRIPSLAAVPSELRSRNHRAALSLTNALAEVRRATRLFHEYTQAPSVQMVAVLADAGSGKTQLAAQLTAESSSRPAGVLLHGRDLYAAQTLDDLARRITIQGRPVPTMDALIAALDSAAERAARRLPIVIDGLNEAEDIRKWKGLLASLEVRLANHPYILVVCTLRTEFADDILPAGFARLSIPDLMEIS